MHAVVCVKQVPEQNSVKITPDKHVDASGINQIISLFDEYAIEEALQWAEKNNGQVTVVSLGNDDATDSLKKALAMGANEAVLINDPALADVGAQGAAKVVAAAIKKLDNVNIVFCGKQSTDDETGQFGPALARFLGWSQLTYVFKVHELTDSHIVVDRALEDTLETVEASLPTVITAVKDLNEPRYPSLLKIRKVSKQPIPTWTLGDLGMSVGDLAGAVKIADRVPPPPRPSGEMISGDAASQAKALVQKLVESQVL
ncbi:MAG: electron transfer flavoprotein subunit beta/FixA family protein [Herpetosiphon sp.]|nr:electron transfer flavoprotein subunit beta/FixA family protein [Herpetosiphon sp.]